MAQVAVNFRMDDEVKRNMEQVCKEMGLSMTTAFTIFATKVCKEKCIPFEITAEPSRRKGKQMSEPVKKQPSPVSDLAPESLSPAAALEQKREWLERLCGEIRRSLTNLYTTIPAALMGLTIERIRLLCSDELKDKTVALTGNMRSVLSDRNTQVMQEKDLTILDEYVNGLSSIAEELRRMEQTLIPVYRTCAGAEETVLPMFEQQLRAVSGQFDSLQGIMQRFVQSTAQKRGTALTVQTRLQRAGAAVSTPDVRAALDGLDALVKLYYDSLDEQTRVRMESSYLQTLELVLEELGRAEQRQEGTEEKAALCQRVIRVLVQMLVGGGRVQRDLDQRSLEAEVVALERLAAMRGDIPDTITREG